MPNGGCFCDKIRISYTGEPKAHVLCHCDDCRKISGASYSNNLLIPEGNFKLESGTPKTISKDGDTGNNITSYFCGDCGTTLYRTGASFPGAVILKAGVLDDKDWVTNNPPKGEFYAPKRMKWIPVIEGAPQMTTMS